MQVSGKGKQKINFNYQNIFIILNIFFTKITLLHKEKLIWLSSDVRFVKIIIKYFAKKVQQFAS